MSMILSTTVQHSTKLPVKSLILNAGYLAQFYANDLLTIVQPPDEEQEQDRDLLRSRQKVLELLCFSLKIAAYWIGSNFNLGQCLTIMLRFYCNLSRRNIASRLWRKNQNIYRPYKVAYTLLNAFSNPRSSYSTPL
jgi:hypothetical protein